MAALARTAIPTSVKNENAIIAGRGLDLTGKLECGTSTCRQRQVNELFRKAWHYFDWIVVDDAVSHQVLSHWEETVVNPKKSLLSDIEVLLYLRKIGAENLVEFRQKPNVCLKHWRLHASQAGLNSVLDASEKFVAQLAKEAQIHVRPHSRGMSSYLFSHPNFEVPVPGQIKLGGVRGKPTDKVRKAVVRDVLRFYIPHLTADITAAKSLGVPLGCTNWLHGELLSTASISPTIANVAFNLDLPILQGVSVETLVKVRNDEYESFQRFRDSIRLAVKERLKADPSARTAELSEQIRLDVIEPELRRIRDRLAAAERAIAKKSVIGIVMGALVTTCGIMAGLPIPVSIAAGVGTASTTETGAATKYLEEKQQAALSDMYFLWKAVKHVANDI
jgi:hypothetical protein